jgi:hypothetical protein
MSQTAAPLVILSEAKDLMPIANAVPVEMA